MTTFPMSTNITKIAGAIKPPARKSEIIEALAIRKREQIIEENKRLSKERDALEGKIQVVAAEEATHAKIDPKQRFYFRWSHDTAGRMRLDLVDVHYKFDASPELREMARRLKELNDMRLHCIPSLHEVRQQVRAAVTQQTPPDARVKALLNNQASSLVIDQLIAKLDSKPQLALEG